ncbi:hypothetical protein V5O48_019194, partial [Marasmius crinis-equi]
GPFQDRVYVESPDSTDHGGEDQGVLPKTEYGGRGSRVEGRRIEKVEAYTANVKTPVNEGRLLAIDWESSFRSHAEDHIA